MSSSAPNIQPLTASPRASTPALVSTSNDHSRRPSRSDDTRSHSPTPLHPTDPSQHDPAEHVPGWLRLYRSSIALSLTNSGSTARDHLANERTYLAWLRTSLSFCGVGVALTQLFSLSSPLTATPVPNPSSPAINSLLLLNNADANASDLYTIYETILAELRVAKTPSGDRKFAKPLGAVLIALGLLILLFGMIRYFSIQSHLTRNLFPASRAPMVAIGGLACAVIIAVLGIILSL